MATAKVTSIKKKKLGKKPGLKASSKAIDNYDKKKKEVAAYNKRVDAEIARRKKILEK